MSTERSTTQAGTASSNDGSRRRWAVLAIIAPAQLMTGLDATVVNIALPSAQSALGFSDADRQWVITAYTLAFGGLLLLGGRLADRFGHGRTLLVALAGFAGASALAGAAPNLAGLIAGRALQGAFGALLAPSALALIAVTFRDPRERGKAFAVYGAVASSGAAVGLLLGGVLTEYVSWRWCLYVNILVAGVLLVVGRAILPRPDGRAGQPTPIGSAVLATGGLVALVIGCANAATDGWSDPSVYGPLLAALVGIVSFVVVQARVSSPLLPLHLLVERSRAGAYIGVAVGVVGSFGLFLILTYHFQTVLEYSPLRTGLAFLPMTLAVSVFGYAVASRLTHRVAPRTIMVPGLLGAAGGLALLSGLDPASGYVTTILPAEVLVGGSMGLIFGPAIGVVTSGVHPREAGIASATANTAMQIGSSVGVAVLNTIAVAATADYRSDAPADAAPVDAVAHGFAAASGGAAIAVGIGAVLVFVLVRAPRPEPHEGRQAGS